MVAIKQDMNAQEDIAELDIKIAAETDATKQGELNDAKTALETQRIAFETEI
jgi:hypothetical protein